MKITPQGKIIAKGEDGVRWELYENGYLLFKPTKEQNTLTNPSPAPSWKEKYGKEIIAIGFTNEVYAPEDSSYLFSKYNKNLDEKLINLQYIDTNKINTYKVTSMLSMFYYASSRLTVLDIGKWNTSNVTNMSAMFEYSMVEVLDLNDWNTNKVSNMELMFSNASKLHTLNIANWDTSNVLYMDYMFNETKSLTNLDIGKWNTRNVVDISHIFSGAKMLQCLNISNWNISNVQAMSYLFYENDKLKLVDCSQMKHPQKIIDLFNQLNKANKLKLNKNCVIIIPN